MSLIYTISRNVPNKEQNLEVPAASGGQYFNKTLLKVKLSTCAAIFDIHCGIWC